jgi:uncharacterized protein
MDGLPFNHAGFQAHLDGERLMGARCVNCGALFVPPRSLCTTCYHAQMEWRALSGQGRLVAFTVIHVGLPVMVAEGHNQHNPYCSGVVRLEEGPAISAQIVGVNSTRPQTIQIGMLVQVVFTQRGQGVERRNRLAFAPLDAG